MSAHPTPSPAELQAFRLQHNLTQQRAADLLLVTLKGYQHWEYGLRRMPANQWELFRLKAPAASQAEDD